MNAQERFNRVCKATKLFNLKLNHSNLDTVDRRLGVCTRVEGHISHNHPGYQGVTGCTLPAGYVGARLARLEAIVFGHSGDYTFWLGKEGEAA